MRIVLHEDREQHRTLPTVQHQDSQGRRLEAAQHAVLHEGQPLEVIHHT